jgi:hypothetical protein
MNELVMIVPSRGRPDAARDLAATFQNTCTAGTRLVIAIDDDDPTRHAYADALSAYPVLTLTTMPGPSTMVKTLNRAAMNAVDIGGSSYGGAWAVGFMGDDHRPRTFGWDQRYIEALRRLKTGMVYGDDLLQGENIPTQIAMTADIVRALGHMAPPVLTHMYVDNYWLDLGNVFGIIRYLPDVIVEHMHPIARKAQWDEGHLRVNQPEMYNKDGLAYAEYVSSGQMHADAAKVAELL